jgi:hypothetical protein
MSCGACGTETNAAAAGAAGAPAATGAVTMPPALEPKHRPRRSQSAVVDDDVRRRTTLKCEASKSCLGKSTHILRRPDGSCYGACEKHAAKARAWTELLDYSEKGFVADNADHRPGSYLPAKSHRTLIDLADQCGIEANDLYRVFRAEYRRTSRLSDADEMTNNVKARVLFGWCHEHGIDTPEMTMQKWELSAMEERGFAAVYDWLKERGEFDRPRPLRPMR